MPGMPIGTVISAKYDHCAAKVGDVRLGVRDVDVPQQIGFIALNQRDKCTFAQRRTESPWAKVVRTTGTGDTDRTCVMRCSMRLSILNNDFLPTYSFFWQEQIHMKAIA